MTILHTNGIHRVLYRLCGCPGAPLPRVQMLRATWFPATLLDPSTCATFELLREFHILSLQAKVSMHHFYVSLHRKSDNTGLRSLPVCLQADDLSTIKRLQLFELVSVQAVL